jgi:hypothetical protein
VIPQIDARFDSGLDHRGEFPLRHRKLALVCTFRNIGPNVRRSCSGPSPL